MFQTFVGNSRRPRQVDLSGRSNNPFAVLSGLQPPNSPQSSNVAIAHAQQERRARQQERERLQAAKTIQRTWRGHASRTEVRSWCREAWDNREGIQVGMEPVQIFEYAGKEESLAQLRMLVRFASPVDLRDIHRVGHHGNRLRVSSDLASIITEDDGWMYPLLRLARIIMASVKHIRKLALLPEDLLADQLLFLSFIAARIPSHIALESHAYYSTLAEISQSINPTFWARGGNDNLLQQTILSLLEHTRINSLTAYEGFVSELLTTASLQRCLDLPTLSTSLNFTSLANCIEKLSRASSNSSFPIKTKIELLWLLAYFICIHRSQGVIAGLSIVPDARFTNIVSNLLSHLADDIGPYTDGSARSSLSSFDVFIQGEISSLVDQEAITGLLAQSKITISADKVEDQGADDTAALAGYALTLLRVFPRRGDEIRMWLHLGSVSNETAPDSRSRNSIPAIKHFWEVVSQTQIFRSISLYPRNAIAFLKLENDRQDTVKASSNTRASLKEREWTILLLFLELYTFVLKVMDDEEFMSGADSIAEHQSWTRRSALPLVQVQSLTIFLKNFAFSLYWNATEILRPEEDMNTGGLASYFGNTHAISPNQPHKETLSKADDTVITRISGMSLGYLKGLVTGLLRMIYERDSRRAFLPKDHWLMTKYFDMEGFIPAVVEEEDYRNQSHQDDVDDDESWEAMLEEENDPQDALIGTHRARQARRMERLRRQQRRTARRKQLEAVTPRLEILQNIPFFIPFTTRVEIFREFIFLDQTRRRNGFIDPDTWRLFIMQNSSLTNSPESRRIAQENLSKHHAKIRRKHCFEDAYQQFYQLGESLKEPIQITFVDQFDTPEAGIDGGGVTKEFLTSVTKEAFAPVSGLNLFIENDQHLLYPNPAAVDAKKALIRQGSCREGSSEWNEQLREMLRHYEFLGRVIGKCLYEEILVDIHFAPFFLVKWALSGGSGSATNESGYRANINDLRDLDEGLYQGLLKLKNYPGDVEDFSLDFTVTDTILNPAEVQSPASQHDQRTITRELRPRGSEIPVTNENRLVYISYMARHRLQIQPHAQTSAFFRGLGSMIQPSWLSMFNQSELQTLLGGDSSEIDVADLRHNTLYGGVYVIGDDNKEHPTVRMFWQVMQALSDIDRRKVIKYITSTPRAPLLGFSQLNPRFSIRDSGSDQERLPSASTCVNLLKLPIYSDAGTLRQKLMYAVNSGAGFDLS